jgi:NAD(P)-dependent dehydrogenase (short-subunit alcohol dehydrogenase family)
VSDTAVSLVDRTILVTGASRGIGAAIALGCATRGAKVVRIARSTLPPLSGAIDITADLANPRARETAFVRIEDAVGIPDQIISNAGTFILAALEESSDGLLREQLAINLEAPFALARRFLPGMRARQTGVHVLVGSVSDHHAFPLNTAYAASKFGLRGLHETLIEEYRGTGVRCALVSPGPTDTKVWDPIDPDSREGFTPRADMLHPIDVAEAVLWVMTRPAHVHVDWLRLGPG